MSEIEEQLPPCSIDAEQSVLASLLIRPDFNYRVTDILKPEHFYRARHGLIYSTMLEMIAEGIPIDFATTAEKLHDKGALEKAGGRQYLVDLGLSIASAEGIEYMADKIIQSAKARDLIKICSQTISQVYDCNPEEMNDLLANAEKSIGQIGVSHLKDTPRALSTIVPEVYKDLMDQYESKQLPGIPSGFHALDELTNGFQPGDLITLAARPAMGKTSLALQIAEYVASLGYVAAFFSLEMDKKKLVRRMLSAKSGIDGVSLARGTLEDDDWTALTEAVAELSESKLHISDNSSATVAEVSVKSNRLKAELKGLHLLVIDYVQLMKGMARRGNSDPNRTQEVSEITRGLKLLAQFLEVPIIALSQLSRAVEMRQNKRPMLSDLRESGSIEQDSDLVVFIYRDDYYNQYSDKRGDAEIIVAKNRNGPIGTAEVRFDAARTRFANKGKRH